MMGGAEQRILILEQRANNLVRDLNRLAIAVKANAQGLTAANQQNGVQGGGGNQGVFACNPSSAMLAASGPPGAGVPTSLPAETVYQMAGGVWTALTGTFPVYNGAVKPILITNMCYLVPDGAGGFVIYDQVCT